MTQVILQPAGQADATIHYADTIDNPVPLARINPFIPDSVRSALAEMYPDKLVPTWGVTPGKNGVNKKKWERIDTGDVVLFARQNTVYSSAVVTLKVHNERLAVELWKHNADGDTWEYVYFLDELQRLDISYRSFNAIVGYKPNNVIQGFTVLDREKSAAVLDELDVGSDVHYPTGSEDDYEALILRLADAGTLNNPSRSESRKEQGLLRKFLFRGQRQAQCGICKRTLPTELLVAAHIKKRSRCTKEERLDYRHIVMPMCHLGCDQLFERGFITVVDGEIKTLWTTGLSSDLEAVLSTVAGKPCEHWNPGTKPYFDWHVNHHGRFRNRSAMKSHSGHGSHRGVGS